MEGQMIISRQNKKQRKPLIYKAFGASKNRG